MEDAVDDDKIGRDAAAGVGGQRDVLLAGVGGDKVAQAGVDEHTRSDGEFECLPTGRRHAVGRNIAQSDIYLRLPRIDELFFPTLALLDDWCCRRIRGPGNTEDDGGSTG